MPGKTILEIPLDEQEQMRRELRAARYGSLRALHVLLLCAEGRTPSEIAEFLLCSRSSVYRVVAAYKRGARWVADAAADGATPRRLPSLKRSLLALLKHAPATYGWCRVRWSCQTLALQLRAQRSVAVSRETIRR